MFDLLKNSVEEYDKYLIDLYKENSNIDDNYINNDNYIIKKCGIERLFSNDLLEEFKSYKKEN